MQALSAHSLAQGSANLDASFPPCHLTAFNLDASEMYRFDHGSKRLLVFNLRLVDDSPDLAVTECVLSPASLLDFDVSHVSVNEIGSLVALHGPHGCCVVALSRRVRSEFNLRSGTVVQIKIVALGHLFFGTHPEVRIIKARWHPASLVHLALLCSDNVVRLFNTTLRDTEDPEQLLRVSIEGLKVVSFDFGSSLDWTHFTVFYLLSDGSIYAQCPVVPFGCPIPEELLSTLELRQQQEIARLDSKLARLNTLKSSGLDVARRIRRTVKRAAGSARALKWIELVRAGKLMAQSDLPVLQGPLTVASLSDSDVLPEDERVCDLLVAGTAFPVVVTLFESGLLELRLQLCSVLPCWVALGSSAARSEVLVLFDRLDVAPSVLRGCGTLASGVRPSVHPDPLHQNVWYVRHAGGIECLALPLLDSVLADLAAVVAENAQQKQQHEQQHLQQPPTLPRAEIASLLQRDASSAGNRIIGMSVIALAAGEYFLAYECESSNGSVLRCLDLLGAGEPTLSSITAKHTTTATTATTTTTATAEDAVVPASLHTVAAWVLELRELDKRRPKAIPHVETLSSGRLTRLEQLQEATQLSEAYKRHAAHIAEGSAILNDAALDMEARKSEVAKLTQMLQAKVRALSDRSDQLGRVCAVVQANDSNLRERLTELSGLLTALRPTLSDAERAYFALLDSKAADLAAMEKTVDGLNKFVESHPAIFKTDDRPIDADVLDEGRLLILQENLDRQNETIAKLVVNVRELQARHL